MTSRGREDVFRAIDGELERTIEDIVKLVRIPSVSSQGKGIEEAAAAVEGLFGTIGCEVRRLTHPGANPAIFARLKGDGKKKLLFYNHYDVQPPGKREGAGTVPPSCSRRARSKCSTRTSCLWPSLARDWAPRSAS